MDDLPPAQGNLAAIGAVPTEAASNDVAFPVVLFFRDAGPGGGTPAQPDGFGEMAQNPNQCHYPLFLIAAAGSEPITRGNILIRDVQP